MAREKSVKVRLTEKEYLFIKQEAERLGVSRSEIVRRLIYKEMESKKND